MKTMVMVAAVLLATGFPAIAQDLTARVVGYYYDESGRSQVLEFRKLAREAGHSWNRQDNLLMPTDGFVQPRTVVRYFFLESKDLALKFAEDIGLPESSLEESNGLQWGMDPSETDYLEVWITPAD